MRDRNTLVFIEVRHRRTNALVSALESISPAKVRKIRNTAKVFLKRHATLDAVTQTHSRRFDVVAIDGIGTEATVDWVKGAFE